MRKNFTYLLFCLLVVFSVNVSFGQSKDDISQYDLSQIKVDQLSDAQIEALLSRAEKEGLTQEQMESMAVQRGMPASEVSKLRKRIEKLKYKNSTKSDKDKLTDRSRTATDKDGKADNLSQNKSVQDRIEKEDTEKDPTEVDLFDVFDEAVKERPEDKIFGFSLFNRKKLTFEPILNIATPQNYVLGPDDEVVIEIWGASQETYQQKITPDGTIFIDNLGVIALNGFTIEEATGKLRKSLSKIYAGLNSGNTFLKVTLGSVRSIKVNIVGDVYRPGTYTLPSLATVFNALYAAGGPSLNGTLRSIKVIRNNKVIANLDLYDFLLKGEQKNNIRIQDQDVIFISPYQNRVELKGEIKRPYFYDMQPDETLADLISFSGGFTGKAYNQRIKINRKTGKEQKIFDVDVKNADSLLMANGDEILVDSVINRLITTKSFIFIGFLSVQM